MPREKDAQDFHYPTAKKPKLSAAPSSSILHQQNDFLWGDDFQEGELDECFELATQACTQHQRQTSHKDQAATNTNRTGTNQNITKNQNNGTTVKVSQKLGPSDIFNVPCGVNVAKDIIPSTKFRPKQWSNVSNKSALSASAIVRPLSASQSQQNHFSSKSIPDMLSVKPNHEQINTKEIVEKLQKENAKLKEDFLTKDGEISNLRIQLKQSEIKATSQLHVKMQEYEAKFRLMEKELEKSKTIAELEKLEAWKAKDKLLMVNQSATQNVPSTSAIPNKTVGSDRFGGLSKVSPVISYGELVLDVVTPHLFIKSSPEINSVELKTTFSLLNDIVDTKRTVFNPIHYTVEICWEPTMQLCLETSFDTVTAQCHIKKIFSKCYKIMCCLLITLRERAEKETDYNLDSRGIQNARVGVDALDDPNLLSHKMWYSIERGVESRRAVGLIAEISVLSQYMADLVIGTSQKSKQSETIQQCPAFQTSHQVLSTKGGPSTAQSAEGVDTEVLHENQSANKTSEGKEEQNKKILQQVESFYQTQEFGFLKLIRDITQIVASQNCSFEYSGFLTGVCKLLTNIQHSSSPNKDADEFLSIFCAIVETIVHSRPRMETTVTLAELVNTLVSNTRFMNALCSSSREKPNQDSRGQNVCALSTLCWLLERECDNIRIRTRICQAVVNWMTFGVKFRPFHGPSWTQCQKPSLSDKCLCRTRMIETMVMLIYETFKDFERFANTSKMESVRSVLVRGIMLLYYQIESDPDFGNHMENVEGSYQLLLMGLKNTEYNLGLDENEASALDELLAMEETITPPKFELTTNLEEHMDTIISTIELGWLDV